jgi:transcription elongation factor S-II
MSTLATVKDLKVVLLKALPAESDAAADQCRDVLQQLNTTAITLEILTETLIGKEVSKLKNHAALGTAAKTLVKKWKKVANASPGSVSKKVKAERRDSTQSATIADAESEWAGLAPQRQAICRKFHSLLAAVKSALTNGEDSINAAAFDHLTGPRAAEIEAAVVQKHGSSPHHKSYVDKARSLAFNLKKNQDLCRQVVLGQVTATALVDMSTAELAPAATQQARAVESARLQDAKRLDWNEANEDKINEMCGIRGDLLKASLFTCGRCKSHKTTSTQKQTRSADEPMTVFVLCLNCGKRWKC